MINQLTNVSLDLAREVAQVLGIEVPNSPVAPVNESKPADADDAHYASVVRDPRTSTDDALSIIKNVKNADKSRKIGFISTGAYSSDRLKSITEKVEMAGSKLMVIAPTLGNIKNSEGYEVKVDETLFNTASVLYDAIIVGDEAKSSKEILANSKVKEFVMDAFNHCKPILVLSDATTFIDELGLPCCRESMKSAAELYIDTDTDTFMASLRKHRHWEREELS
jgi:catalase